MRFTLKFPALLFLLVLTGVHPLAYGQDNPYNVVIPQLGAEPGLSDFAGMAPSTALARQMARIDGFVQREPIDGAPATQRTEVYLGYDQSHLYAVFLAFDTNPALIRANLASRENIGGTVRKKMGWGKEKSPVIEPGSKCFSAFLSQTTLAALRP